MKTNSRTMSEPSAGALAEILSQTEHVVAALWEEVLADPPPLVPGANFFALGGDSVAMVTVLYRIREEFLIELPPSAMFNAPSLRQLSALIDAARDSAQLSPQDASCIR